MTAMTVLKMNRLQKMLRGWRASISLAKGSDSLYSVEEMRRILDRERMRSDRGNSTFTLLTYTFPTPCGATELAAMAKVFRNRLRMTDDAGLLEPNRIGVVLPETPPEGAWKLARDIRKLLPFESRRYSCDVYVYPTHVHSDPSRGEPLETAKNGAVRNGAAANGVKTNGAAVNGSAFNGRVAHVSECRARSMNTLFVQPLPAWKRATDVLGAALALLLAAPIMLAVAVAIKLTSHGPIIFTQKRDTIGGRQFMIYKFRTMSVGAEHKKAALLALNEQDGPAFKIAKDPRVTRLGRFLRETSIDELPQLFNVLTGDMTLVGPRAMDSDESRHCESWQRRRLDVTAGITGIWQVRARSTVSFTEWMRMDLSYIRSRSLVNDLKLIAQTVPAVLLRRGAY
jgi:lipopolysaccharide/colanic/teichoic acid biosynthesis glycosyltransferase